MTLENMPEIKKTHIIIVAVIIGAILTTTAVTRIRNQLDTSFPYQKVKQVTGMNYIVLGETRIYGTHFTAYSYNPTDETLEPPVTGEWITGFVDRFGNIHIIRFS